MKHSGQKKMRTALLTQEKISSSSTHLELQFKVEERKKKSRKLFKEIIARLLKPTQRSEGHYWFKCLIWFMHRRGLALLTSSGTWISTDGSKQCSPTKCNCLLFLLFPGRDHQDSFDQETPCDSLLLLVIFITVNPQKCNRNMHTQKEHIIATEAGGKKNMWKHFLNIRKLEMPSTKN